MAYPPQGLGDIDLKIDEGIANHAALTATHGVTGDILGTEDKDIADGIPSLTANSELSPHNIKKGVSDTLRNSHDTQRTTPDNWYNKQLIMAFPNGFIGNARVKIDCKTNNATYPCYARVYKNGSPLGTEIVEPSTSFITHSEDLALDQSPADTLEVWLKSGGSGVSVFVTNFRLYYDDNPVVAVIVDNSTP